MLTRLNTELNLVGLFEIRWTMSEWVLDNLKGLKVIPTETRDSLHESLRHELKKCPTYEPKRSH